MKSVILLLVISLVISGSKKERMMKWPLKEGVVIPHDPKGSYENDTVTLVNICPGADTIVRSCFKGKITAIFNYDTEFTIGTRTDSLFAFYSGLDSVLVKKGQTIGLGDPIGIKSHSSKNDSFIVYQIYINRNAVNPRRFIVYDHF
jgi:hypothetical protein